MGGSGSTRWTLHWKRITVEECLPLSITELRRAYGKSATSLPNAVGTITWSSGEQVGWSIINSSTDIVFRLIYTVIIQGQPHNKAPTIRISTTPCNYGGVRYWFHCPQCNRRIAKLYMNWGNFACRDCHNLSYTSAQEAHRFDGLRRIIGPGFDRLDESFEVQHLVEKWESRKRLTKGERKKIARAMFLPLFMVRSRWYRPETRAKQKPN